MVKNTKNYINDKRRIKIPIRSILFWRRKIKSYINTHLLNIIINKKYPTIYISKKYPKMSILELYERINNHLNKYFPNIYQKLNSNTKKCLIKLKKNPEDSIKKEKDNNKESSNNIKSNKNMYVLIKLRKRNKLSEKIKHIN
jgi:MinD-like ATPase involved in chromosome partitioning or flagellar assembly